MKLRFELREFSGLSFGERHEVQYGSGLDEFEDYVEQFTDEPEDEQARPWDGIVAARKFERDGKEFSCFAVRADE